MQKLFITLSFLFAFLTSYKANAQCKAAIDYLIGDTTNTFQFYNTGSWGFTYGNNWDFGDGSSQSYIDQPRHKYTKKGTYKVTFIVFSFSLKCADTAYVTIVADGKNPCNADFTAIQDKSNALKWYFKAKDTLEDYYTWYTPVSSGSTKNHSATFTSTGSYKVYLDVGNSKDHCRDTVTKSINVKQCSADFTYKLDSANKNKVYFSNLSSTSTNMKYKWYFGNGYGYSSTTMNPTYAYNLYYYNYKVCLEIRDSTTGCNDSICKTVSAGIVPCDSSFSYRVSNDSVFFNYSASGIKLIWDFGDGTIDTVKTQGFHIYKNQGNYFIRLRFYCPVTKYNQQYVAKITIKSVKCKADFSYKSDTSNWYKINFTNLSSANTSVKYYWYFGNGYNSTSKHPNLIYDSAGNYTVCLWINDTATKCKDTICKTVTVSKKLCDSSFSYTVKGDTIYLQYNGNGTNIKWEYTLGASQFADSGKTSSYSFNKYGTVKVCLWLTCPSSSRVMICKSITLKCSLKLKFSSKLISSRTMEFTDLSSLSKNSNYWNFGDGSYSSYKNPTHTYTTPGFYRVLLYTYDSTTSCSDTISSLILVTHKGPKCKADFAVVTSTMNISRYSFYSVRDTAGVLHTWTVNGVKDSSNMAAMIRIFTTAGTYRVCLYLNDTINKCKDSICTNISVSSKCNADFTYKSDSSNKLKVNFTNLSSKSSTMRNYWDFGDGTYTPPYSSNTNPTHIYKTIGNYYVRLSIRDSVCNDDTAKFVDIGAGSCKALFTDSVDFNNSNRILFYNISSYTSTASYLWDFDDGTTSKNNRFIDQVHTYNKAGKYNVCLYLADSATNCYDTICRTITIKPKCQALFTVAIDTTQKFKLFLINKSSNTSSTHYTWDFGDGSYSGSRNPSHKYSKFGKFKVCLTILDTITSCYDTMCKTLGLDSNGKLLKAGAWELVVIDETVFGVKKIVKSDFKIYPNPANTKVTIDLSNATNSYQKLEILNANGQVCIAQPIEKGSEAIEVDLERITRGLYLIKLSNDDGYSYMKLMKN